MQRQKSTGQTLVEFALVLPIFFLLLAGIIDFANIIYYRNRIMTAGAEGAKVASQISASDITWTTSTNWSQRCPGCTGTTKYGQVPIAKTRTQRILADSGIPWWTVNVTATAVQIQNFNVMGVTMPDRSAIEINIAYSANNYSFFFIPVMNQLGGSFSVPEFLKYYRVSGYL